MMIMQMLTMTWMVLHKMKNSRHEKYKKTFCLEFVVSSYREIRRTRHTRIEYKISDLAKRTMPQRLARVHRPSSRHRLSIHSNVYVDMWKQDTTTRALLARWVLLLSLSLSLARPFDVEELDHGKRCAVARVVLEIHVQRVSSLRHLVPALMKERHR